MGNDKKKHRKRNNYPVKQQQTTKARNEPAETSQPPIAQSLLNTANDYSNEVLQTSIDVLEVLNKLAFGENGSLQKNSDRMYRLFNIPAPRLYYDRFVSSALHNMAKKINNQLTDEQGEAMLERINEIAASPSAEEADRFLAAVIDEMFLPDRVGKFFARLSENEMKAEMRMIPLDVVEGITFYHGTSYENYLQIKIDGFIRCTNYADFEDRDNKNGEKYLRSHTGHVFFV